MRPSAITVLSIIAALLIVVSCENPSEADELEPVDTWTFFSIAGDESVMLLWSPPFGVAVSYFTLSYSDGGTTVDYPGNLMTTSLVVDGLTNSTEYDFTLLAFDSSNAMIGEVSVSAEPAAPPVGLGSSSIGVAFDASDYGGCLSMADGAFASCTADGFLSIRGSITPYAGISPSHFIELSKGTESTWYFVDGPFDEDIWLRFADGDYELSVYQVADTAQNSEGVLSWWSYYTPPVVSLDVTNMNTEDGRYLYPSAVIQSDDADIVSAAAAVSESGPYGSTVMNRIRNTHDEVVLHVTYDDYLTNKTDRVKQDAVSVLASGDAVCEGYSTLYAALLRAYSIPTAYVTGWADYVADDRRHAWNFVSDDTQWKYVDTTWDDPDVGSSVMADYFWDELWSDHILEEIHTSRTAVATVSSSTSFPGYPDGSY